MVGLFSYPKRKLKKLIKDGEYEEAIEFGKSLEKKFSNDADYYFIMGSIYYILEDAKTTLQYFDKAASLNPNDIEIWLLKANVHLHLGEKDKVIDCCNKIFNVDPEHKEAEAILGKLKDL